MNRLSTMNYTLLSVFSTDHPPGHIPSRPSPSSTRPSSQGNSAEQLKEPTTSCQVLCRTTEHPVRMADGETTSQWDSEKTAIVVRITRQASAVTGRSSAP